MVKEIPNWTIKNVLLINILNISQTISLRSFSTLSSHLSSGLPHILFPSALPMHNLLQQIAFPGYNFTFNVTTFLKKHGCL
jgi:hypothetical protein